MKLSCTRENLHQGLSITSHLMTKNVNLPVLQNVLVTAEGGSIKFTATNLEMAVHCSVRGKVESPGEYTIPSKLFYDYVSLLPNETIHVEVEEGVVHISCGSHKTKINGISASEFPLIPSVEGSQVHQIPVAEFKRALTQTLFATATNESRPELTGVFMKFSVGNGEGRLTCASTDSYRLAEQTIPVISPVEQEISFIVPARALAEMSRILSVVKDNVDLPESVSLQLTDNQLVFSYGPVELTSRTIEGVYPDYTQIIPTQFQTEAVLDREDFMKAVKTASLFSRQGLFDVTLEFTPGQNELSVKAVDASRGENTTTCQADTTGVANQVTVNYRYLLDGLGSISTDTVLFQMIDSSNPCLVTPHGKTDAYQYIVMPIKQ